MKSNLNHLANRGARWVRLSICVVTLAATSSRLFAADSASAFAAWLGQYSQATNDSQKTQLASQGLSLAQQRRAALSQWIKTEPQRAVASAIPVSVRAQLPADIVAQLETPVSAIGDLTVNAFLQAKGGPRVQPLERMVKVGGTSYRAYVYGRRSSQTSKQGIPLYGVALDGELALGASALRRLASDETPDPAKTLVNVGQQTGQPVLAELGNTIYRFGSAALFEARESALEAAEAGLNPVPSQSADTIIQSGASPSPNPPSAWTTGRKGVLVIRVDFSDLAGDPSFFGIINGTAAYCQNLMDNNVGPYYLRSSYGLTTLTNTVTTQLYRMPQTSVQYATTPAGNGQLHLDAEAAAAADYDVQSYDRIVVLFSFLGTIPGSFINYGGLAQIVGKSVWVNGEFDFRVVAHELGHTYGLFHAALWDVSDGNPISPSGVPIEYGDDFDTMGANFANSQATDFNPFYKNQLGWLPDSAVQTITSATSGTFRLYAFDWANWVAATNHTPMALRFVKDGQRDYWVGIRRNFVDNPYMSHGAYVFWGFADVGGGGGGGFQSGLLDMTTPGRAPGANLPTDYDAALAGQVSFSDASIGVTIKPSTEGGSVPDAFQDIEINGGGTFQMDTNFVTGGNGNGVVDFNECNDLHVKIVNHTGFPQTGLSARITTTTPGVLIPQSASLYPDMADGATNENISAFKISTAPDFLCGTPIQFEMVLKSAQATTILEFKTPSGSLLKPTRFDSTNFVFIPDAFPPGSNSYILVTNINSAVSKVTVSLFITHTFDSDLTIELISPDNTTNTLSAHHGVAGQNYGLSCSPDSLRTTFDDAAATAIGQGVPPFLGSYIPDTPLAVFEGKSGTNVNGVWTLHVVDDVSIDFGFIQCWSLNISSPSCVDGGGECPGSDLAIGMVAQPEPVVLGNTMTYTISVTNNGPSTATNTTVAHVLPPSVIFQSATASQGGFSQNGGVVTVNFGSVRAGGRATATVTVLPTTTGVISSSATAASGQNDPDSSNNSVTIQNHVAPPTSDLVLGLAAAPEPVVVGGSLTYTVSVTNNGPSDATQVTVSNNLPPSVAILNVGPSQGSFSVLSNVVICSFGTVFSGSRASATINVRPSAQGVYSASASVAGAQLDPLLANNSANVSSTVLPAADLALTLAASSSSVVVGSNFTYQINVVNNGPNPASGVALNGTFPASLTVVSNFSSHGALNISGGQLIANLGSFVSGEQAGITLVLSSSTSNSFVSTFSVAGAEADPNLVNNSASTLTTVDVPKVIIAAFGVNLTSESLSPTNGAVDIGETLGADFYLSNIGNVNSLLLSASLLSTNGVLTDPSTNTQALGIFQPGGAPLKAHFTFTATGTNGGAVTAVVRLLQGGNPATNPPVNFVFGLPNVLTFSNTGAITIRDVNTALPYPSTLNVSGVTGTVGNVAITLSNMTHGFPQDVDALVSAPSSQKTILMSAAGAPPLENVNVTFDDRAPSPVPDIGGTIASTSYRPANYGDGSNLPAPAPTGPYPAAMSVFNGTDPNGTWSLFVQDHSAGDTGSIAGGWSVAITLISPVNKLADVALLASSSANPILAGNNLIYTFTVTNRGPDAASNVRFTDTLPAGLTYVSSSTNVTLSGSTVSGNLGSLAAHATATVSITAAAGPALSNPFANTASVTAFEVDLNLANNTNTVSTGLTLPLSELALSLASATNVVVAGSNVTYSITVSNAGPGDALNVLVTNVLPPGLSSVTVSNPLGGFTVGGGVATASIARLTVSNTAVITIKGNAPGAPATLTNSASVVTASQDTNSANNAATTLVSVVAPAPAIVLTGVSLTSESYSPANGAIDPGETVTVSFSLRNAGLVNASGVTATLQASGGVTPIPPVQMNYGSLPAGGGAVANTFSFTANGVSGGTLITALLINNGATFLGTVTNAFAFPSITTFSNNAAITIPDHGGGSPYPSAITVTNMPGLLSKVKVGLVGVTHGFPRDINALLVSPAGGKVLLMSHAGGPQAITNPITLTFDDAASGAIPSTGPLTTSTNQPASYFNAVSFPSPAPVAPYGSTLASLAGASANGTWKLYVFDDSAGDAGLIGSGWNLQLTTLNSINPVADVSLGMLSTPPSVFIGGVYTNIISVSNAGPGSATGVVVTNTFPLGVSLQSPGSPPPGLFLVIGGGSVTFSAGTLASGASTNFSVVLVPTLGNLSLTNLATVGANESDLNLANNSVQSVVSTLVVTPATLSGAVISNQFELTVIAEPNLRYVIQASADLSTWVSLSTNTASAGGTIKYIDTTSPAPTRRYYRAVRVLP